MFKFITNAMTELEHVVWPTPNETRKYMIYTVGVIVILATFLDVLGFGIRNGLSFVRGQFDHAPIQTTVSGEQNATQEDLSGILQTLDKKKKAATGATTKVISTGSTIKIGTGAAQ